MFLMDYMSREKLLVEPSTLCASSSCAIAAVVMVVEAQTVLVSCVEYAVNKSVNS